MKVQPIDVDSQAPPREVHPRADSAKPVFKSRLRRLFDRQFPSVLRNASSSTEKLIGAEAHYGKDGGTATASDQLEPSSVCLAKMVQNFIEEGNEKASKYGRHRCNCFNGNGNDSSDDEFDVFGGFGESLSGGSFSDAGDALKNLIPCATVAERNILADAAKIVEKNKNLKRKDDLKNIVTENLSSLGYNVSICKSKWEKTSSYPAGEYEYTDVIIEGERLLIDIDFRSEFEIARSTSTYKAILQSLPFIFVGKSDRLAQIVSIVSEAAKQSLKKKGMHIPPWRKAEYMRAKWLSPSCTRARNDTVSDAKEDEDAQAQKEDADQSDGGELDLIFGEKATTSWENSGETQSVSESEKQVDAAAGWQPPAIRPKSVQRGAKMVTGLACLLKEKA